MKINSLKFNNSTIHKMYHGDELVNKIGDAFTYMEASGDTPTPPTPSYDTQYLTIESTSNNNTIYLKASYSYIAKTISASTDNGSTWTAYTSSTAGTTIARLNAGDKVLLKGENSTYASALGAFSKRFNYFTSTGQFNAYGNMMSLISGDSFENADTLTANYTFAGLFSGCTGLISAENLVLPATTLTYNCYREMFADCTSLTIAPKLPATTLAQYCYYYMFRGCTSITVAPELPATTLAAECYCGMFYGCTSLTTAPELPATTLVSDCYKTMFYGCTSLNYITCLATDISATHCTGGWVDGVASSGTFVKAASMSSWTTGRDGIPSGWTVQNDR